MIDPIVAPENPFLNPVFKGWAKPGPIPPGIMHGPHPEPDETLDAISGYFRIFQLRDGHRFSTDDLLTAWYATSWAPSPSRVLELGSGIGTAGLISAWRLPGSSFVTIEAQERSVQLARKSIDYNGLKSRFELKHGDFRGPGILRAEETFDLIIGTPPYFPHGTGIEGDHPQKIACRFESRGNIFDYCRRASQHLGPSAFFVCILPDVERMQAATVASGLSIVRQRPVIFKEGEHPLLTLFCLTKATDLPERLRGSVWVEPPLIIRRKDGSIHPEYSAVKLSIGFPP